jgi:hypothetical protein
MNPKTYTQITRLASVSLLLSVILCPRLARSQHGITPDQIKGFGERDPLSQQDLENAMIRLCNWQTHFPVYSFYLLNIPFDNASVLTPGDASPDVKWYPISKVQERQQGFLFGTPATMRPTNKTIFVAPSAREESFVWVNGLPQSNKIPVGIARGLADSFLAGMITNLFMNSYGSEFNLSVSILDNVPFSELPQSDRAKLPQLSEPRTYGYTSTHKVSEDEFDEKMATLSRELNLQPTGMLLGWRCANEILNSGADSADLQTAIWKLIRNRFSGREIARIAAYTTSYLEGWSKGTSQRTITTPPAANLNTVFQDLGTTVTPPQDRLAIKFYQHLLGVYTVAAATQSKDAPKMKIMRDIVEGYYEGTVAASDNLFKAAYELGFNQGGFEKGLKDSYTAGFVLAKQSKPGQDHLQVAGVLNQGIDSARDALKNTPWGQAAQTACNIANQIPSVQETKAKMSNWISKRIGFKVRL